MNSEGVIIFVILKATCYRAIIVGFIGGLMFHNVVAGCYIIAHSDSYIIFVVNILVVALFYQWP